MHQGHVENLLRQKIKESESRWLHEVRVAVMPSYLCLWPHEDLPSWRAINRDGSRVGEGEVVVGGD